MKGLERALRSHRFACHAARRRLAMVLPLPLTSASSNSAAEGSGGDRLEQQGVARPGTHHADPGEDRARRSRSYAPPPRRSSQEPRRLRRSEAKARRAWRRRRRSRRSPKSIPTRTLLSLETGCRLVGEGLEEAYDEADDILVVRELWQWSADAATQDWPKIIQEFLETHKKVAFAVVMLGANDRKPIREGEFHIRRFPRPGKRSTASVSRACCGYSRSGACLSSGSAHRP